jgi:hypothetical protein
MQIIESPISNFNGGKVGRILWKSHLYLHTTSALLWIGLNEIPENPTSSGGREQCWISTRCTERFMRRMEMFMYSNALAYLDFITDQYDWKRASV